MNKKKYKNNIKDLTKKLLKVFNENNYKSYNYKQLAYKLGVVDSNGRNQIIKKLRELLSKNKINEISKGKFKINNNIKYHIGKIDLTANGNGYFICDDFEQDIFVPNVNLNHALHNDLVKCYVYNKRKNKKLESDVVKILERSKIKFVGTLQMSKNFGFVVPDNNKMYVDIFISKSQIGNAENGDKVLAEITQWPDNSKNPFGKINEVLGKPGEHDTEIHSILLEYGLPYEFNEEVEKDASNLPVVITSDEIKKRRDMRLDLTFTIDPRDAKDFDDALSFKKLENGNYEIGIHIADVSHYVQLGTILDEEAYQRATSVYLVDRVVPMLPELLSNGVCSLRPNEEKLTFSAVFEINNKAQIINKWFGKTIIYSDKRFTYEEAQVIIESKNNLIPSNISLINTSYKVDDTIVEAILKLDFLAKKLRKKRMDKGAISFDRLEVKFNLNKKLEPTGVYFKESKDANKLIEEFMLLANREVAEFIGFNKNKKTNNTFIYRVHNKPNIEKLLSLQNIIGKFGYKINTENKDTTSKSLNKLLKDVVGKAEANMIEILTIRSMSKATYSTQNIGHYGLAFEYYSHFTSPIRRYPDIMTHRLLQHYLNNGKSPNSDDYEIKCKHSSKREELASKAERDSIKYMQVKYMQNYNNNEFKGVISGITEWGVYVEIIENKCEGMVRIRDIKDDYYIFDEKQYAIVGQSTKNIIQLGDEVIVKVKKADLERKQLDFQLLKVLN